MSGPKAKASFKAGVCGGAVAALTALLQMGCAHNYVVPDVVGPKGAVEAKEATAGAKYALDGTKKPPDKKTCDVQMVIRGTGLASHPICIKRTGAPFRFPSPIYLEGAERMIDTQFNGMCTSEDGKGDQRCQWSHLFRSSYPISFTIKAATEGEPLSKYAHVIRVFRNGKLVFSWKDDDVLTSLDIPGETLTARLMPFGAPMDLRIIPTGTPDDPSIQTAVDKTIDPITSRLEIVGGVLAGPSGALGDLPAEVKCVSWMVASAKATALQLVGKPFTAPGDAPAGCQAPPAGDAQALHDKIVAAVQAGAQQIDADVEARIRDLGTRFGVAVQSAAEKAKAALEKKGKELAGKPLSNGLTAERTVDQVNQLTAEAAQIFDTVLSDVRSTVANLQRLVNDRDAQARQYAAVTDALTRSGSVFDPFTKNPDLVQGEKALDMKYGDKFQFFVLSPWNGLPIRVTRNVGASLSVETAIPILDLVGFRYQWGTGRGDSVRVGAGVVYFKDEDQVMPLGAGTMQTTSVFNVASELSVSWFGFMMGAGYVLNSRDSFGGFWDRDRIRVIVGADLLKVFGNTPAEAFSF